jgi:hypothetical protein
MTAYAFFGKRTHSEGARDKATSALFVIFASFAMLSTSIVLVIRYYGA